MGIFHPNHLATTIICLVTIAPLVAAAPIARDIRENTWCVLPEGEQDAIVCVLHVTGATTGERMESYVYEVSSEDDPIMATLDNDDLAFRCVGAPESATCTHLSTCQDATNIESACMEVYSRYPLVTVYEHGSYSGRSITWAANGWVCGGGPDFKVKDLARYKYSMWGGNWDNIATSAEVHSPCRASFFEHPNLGGHGWNAGNWAGDEDTDDKLSSFTVR